MPRNIVFLFIITGLFCFGLMHMFGGCHQPPATRSNTIEFFLITTAMCGWMLFAVDGETAGDIRVSVVFGIGALFLVTAWLTGYGLDELFA
ncbi:MAG: hypothetical protein JWN73_3353 [Betaproteobacteria bacterium]|nr:hypothetical protein [Betaproteobacteria bacterium]